MLCYEVLKLRDRFSFMISWNNVAYNNGPKFARNVEILLVFEPILNVWKFFGMLKKTKNFFVISNAHSASVFVYGRVV
jgi:hypothetical protein